MLLTLVIALAQAGADTAAPPLPGAPDAWGDAPEPLELPPSDPFDPLEVPPLPSPDAVVGGAPAQAGAWDDAVGILLYGAYVGCTGTLIAPDLVITAAHCAEGVTDVLVGTTDWSTDAGERIDVTRVVTYPDWRSTFDVAVLELAEWSSYAPRPIAIDCILDDYLVDGAEVAVVGFGSTETDGNGYNATLNEGWTRVQDHDCSEDTLDGIETGCEDAVRPGGELGAGGNGVDSCYGDSGGPLYLPTPEGSFLVGVTSRGYAGNPAETPCLQGGVYVRPDAVFDWIEEVTGRRLPAWSCNEAPEVTADDITTRAGESASTRLEVVDDGSAWHAELAEAPLHGTVEVSPDGQVVYTPDPDFAGVDDFVVAVVDDGHPVYERSGPVTVELSLEARVEEPESRFLGIKGCTQAPGPATGGLVGLAGLLVLRRRSRRSP